MTTFVLVPGMWIGAWAWRDVTAALRAAGHEVYPMTLTGLAERAHLTDAGRGRVGLDTHIDDIVRLLEAEDLRDVVLVGHSYGGVPVGCAADRVPQRLARAVYVDSGPFPDGMAQIEFNPPEEQERIRARAASSGLVPPPAWDPADPATGPALLAGLDEAALTLLRTRATPHPLASVTQPASRPPEPPSVPATLVSCTLTPEQVRQLIDAGTPTFAGLAGAEVVALPTGHWPMLSEPAALASLLPPR